MKNNIGKKNNERRFMIALLIFCICRPLNQNKKSGGQS